jgi:hypothetical protein
MDKDPLVELKVNDGRRLLKELEREGFDVTVAFWARTGEDGKWKLYVASKVAETNGLAGAYRVVYAALQRLLDPSIAPADLKVIRTNDPMARDVLAARANHIHLGAEPVGYAGQRLGDVPVDGAYIYPPPPYHLTPPDAMARAASLMIARQSGQTIRPTRVQLRDGSTRQVIPVGWEADAAGSVVMKFADASTGQQFAIPIQEVVGID